MIKFKNGSKINKLLFSLIVLLSLAFTFYIPLVTDSFGVTYCVTDSLLTPDSSWFDYTADGFIDRFDFACNSIYMFTNATGTNTTNIKYRQEILKDSSLTAFSTSLRTSGNYFVYYYGESVTNNDADDLTYPNYSYYTATNFVSFRYQQRTDYPAYVIDLNFTGGSTRMWRINNYDFVYGFQGNDNRFYYGISKSLYDKYVAYVGGYGNGYTNGYDDGISTDLDYQDGLNTALYGVFYNARVDLVATFDDAEFNVANANYDYIYGGLRLPDDYAYGYIYGVGDESADNIDVTITFNKPFVFKTGYSEISYAIGEWSILGLSGYTLTDVNGKVYTFNYSQQFLDDPNIVSVTDIVCNDPTVNGALIVSLNYYMPRPSDFIYDVVFSQPGNAYNVGYTEGYNNGVDNTDSNAFNNGYAQGYGNGYDVGYSDGSNDGVDGSNTFFGLISAVIDAPISYARSLLNFDLLGFNLFNFFTALITCSLLLWLAIKILSLL